MKHQLLDLDNIARSIYPSSSTLIEDLRQLTSSSAVLREYQKRSSHYELLQKQIENQIGFPSTLRGSLDRLLHRSGIAEFAELVATQNRTILEEYRKSVAGSIEGIEQQYKAYANALLPTATDLLASRALTRDISSVRSQVEALASQLAQSSHLEREYSSVRRLQQLLQETSLSDVAFTADGELQVSGESIEIDGSERTLEQVIIQSEEPIGLLEGILAWLSSLAPAVRAAVLYVLLPYVISIVANINTPMHEEWWKSIRSDRPREAKKELRAEALGSYTAITLAGFRFVSAKELTVHMNPRQQSPILVSLRFGVVVRPITRHGSWTYVEYSDPASGETQQGWLLSRYITSFTQ